MGTGKEILVDTEDGRPMIQWKRRRRIETNLTAQNVLLRFGLTAMNGTVNAVSNIGIEKGSTSWPLKPYCSVKYPCVNAKICLKVVLHDTPRLYQRYREVSSFVSNQCNVIKICDTEHKTGSVIVLLLICTITTIYVVTVCIYILQWNFTDFCSNHHLVRALMQI
jgi:hypothetical protein